MLPGWHAHWDQGRWVYLRDVLRGTETYLFHPRIIAAVECIQPPHEIGTISYPINQHGHWYPQYSLLAHITNVLTETPAMLRWPHAQAENVLVLEQQYPNTPPEYL